MRGSNILPNGKKGALMPTILTPAELGLLAKTTRKQLGMTQSEIALAAGVGLRFIVDLEAGKETVQLGKALAVLASLGIQLLADAAEEAQ